MNILIVGGGLLGRAVAQRLDDLGHGVMVVDEHAENLALLPPSFGGVTFVGFPMDLNVLRRAGIENCEAVAAVSQDDNVNIMVCQLAEEIFKVKKVIARIYDPAREGVFSHFGLNTICPTNITVDSMHSALLEQETQHLSFGCSAVSFKNIPVPPHLVGISTDQVDEPAGEEIFAVLRGGRTFIFASQQPVTLAADDRLVIAKLTD